MDLVALICSLSALASIVQFLTRNSSSNHWIAASLAALSADRPGTHGGLSADPVAAR
jgi:hypothetical protein